MIAGAAKERKKGGIDCRAAQKKAQSEGYRAVQAVRQMQGEPARENNFKVIHQPKRGYPRCYAPGVTARKGGRVETG